MEKFYRGILAHRRSIVISFVIIAIVSAFMMLGVKVNYNMADYLPPSAQSTKAVEIMETEFTEGMPNTNVLVHDVGVPEALDYKAQLEGIAGVTQVMWLDDVADVKVPLDTLDTKTVEGFYKDGDALFSVTIAEGQESSAVNAIRAMIGSGNAASGQAADTNAMQATTGAEVGGAIAILLPAIIIILVLTTTSWLEPLLFLIAIGIAIIINMGTNLIFGEVSFITNSVSPILQLAISLDFAIFLLHSFADFRQKYDDPTEAMVHAMKRAMTAIAASACATTFGFLALTFMDFGIGANLGLSLAKGIFLSFISSILFLPAFTMMCLKWLDKTRHRPFMPQFRGVWRGLSKVAVPVTIVAVLLAVPAFLGHNKDEFTYGSGDAALQQDTRNGQDTTMIEEEFGKSTVMAVLVPKGDVVKEYELSQDLEQLDHVTSVVSYANTVGTGIPADWLASDVTDRFYSENYARIVVYTDTPNEGEVAFATVEAVNDAVAGYYDTGYYSAGQSANLYDMKNVIADDNLRVYVIEILAIFLVLLIAFRSALLPFLILFTIEVSIWINLAIPYFTDSTINFLGFLVVNTVQLAATVDYAILLTSYYKKNRAAMPLKEAIKATLGQSFRSILVSALILSIAGFTLAFTSTNAAVSEIGLLLGRGTLISFIMIVCLLPMLLIIFDKAIAKLTWRSGFVFEKKPPKEKHPTAKAAYGKTAHKQLEGAFNETK